MSSFPFHSQSGNSGLLLPVQKKPLPPSTPPSESGGSDLLSPAQKKPLPPPPPKFKIDLKGAVRAPQGSGSANPPAAKPAKPHVAGR